MTSSWLWLAKRVVRRLWFRASLISLLAVAAALLAFLVGPYIPADVSAKVGADSVDRILGIISSSMLAVTTFSLSTMVAAYAAATGSASPRATDLLIEDATTQNVLATFVGSFLYSLVSIILLSTGFYGPQERLVLFIVTLIVVLLIVITLLRWIDYLVRLGRLERQQIRLRWRPAAQCASAPRGRAWAACRSAARSTTHRTMRAP